MSWAPTWPASNLPAEFRRRSPSLSKPDMLDRYRRLVTYGATSFRRRPGPPGGGASLPESGRPTPSSGSGPPPLLTAEALAEPVSADCPECRSAGSVVGGRCQVCDERRAEPGTAVLPPAVPAVLRLSDVVAELNAIRKAGGKAQVEEACRRVEGLFRRLQDQFLTDVVLDDHGFLASKGRGSGPSVQRTFT
jgi:hypothetical protein